LGYVDDAAFALAKSRSLVGRGYGEKRVEQALRIAGVGEEDKASARALAAAQSVEAALRFAQRRRLGPYAPAAPDAKGRDRALSAMIRAGHSFALARAIVNQLPGSDIDADALSEHVRNPAE
jgi:regulatory protein